MNAGPKSASAWRRTSPCRRASSVPLAPDPARPTTPPLCRRWDAGALFTVDDERLVEGLNHAAGHQVGVVRPPFEQQGELVSTQPCDGVAWPDAGNDSLADTDQNGVRSRVAQTVVDQFEVVDIDRYDSNRTVVALAASSRGSVGREKACGWPARSTGPAALGRQRRPVVAGSPKRPPTAGNTQR